jgi:uncharacterized membrane protein
MASFQGMYSDLRSHRSTGGSVSRSPFILQEQPTSLPMETIQEAVEGDSVSQGGLYHPSSVTSHDTQTTPPPSVSPTTETIRVPTETQNDIEIIKDSVCHKSQSSIPVSRNRIKERLGKRLNVSLCALSKTYSNPFSIPYELGRGKSSPAGFFSKRRNARQLQASKAEPNGRDETEEMTTTLEDTRDHEEPGGAEESTVDEIRYIIRRGGESSLSPDLFRDDSNSILELVPYKKPVRRAPLFANGLFLKMKRRQPESSTTATEEMIHYIIKRGSASVSVDFPNDNSAAFDGERIMASSIASHKSATLSRKTTTVPSVSAMQNGPMQQEAAGKTQFDGASRHSHSLKDSYREIVPIGQSPIDVKKCGSLIRQRWKRLQSFGRLKKKTVLLEQDEYQKSASNMLSKQRSLADSRSQQLSGSQISNYIGLDGTSVVSNLTSVTGVTGRNYYGEENDRAIAVFRRGEACQQTLAGTFDAANQCFWHMMTVDQLLQLKEDDEDSDVVQNSASQSFLATSIESMTEDEDTTTQAKSAAVEHNIHPTAKHRKAALNDWRVTSKSFRPSPVFRLLKKWDSGSTTGPGGETKSNSVVVSKNSLSPLAPTKAFDESTPVVSRFWAVVNAASGMEEEEETLTTNTFTEKSSRQYHRRRRRATGAAAAAAEAATGDNIFSMIFGLR